MSFKQTMAENVAELVKWHSRRHLLEWPDCVTEPCNHLDSEFRKVWSK
jgi:hypothetical protein